MKITETYYECDCCGKSTKYHTTKFNQTKDIELTARHLCDTCKDNGWRECHVSSLPKEIVIDESLGEWHYILVDPCGRINSLRFKGGAGGMSLSKKNIPISSDSTLKCVSYLLNTFPDSPEIPVFIQELIERYICILKLVIAHPDTNYAVFNGFNLQLFPFDSSSDKSWKSRNIPDYYNTHNPPYTELCLLKLNEEEQTNYLGTLSSYIVDDAFSVRNPERVLLELEKFIGVI